MEKVLTVAMPAFNVGRYLRDGIKTFLHSEILDDIEILIINDGSKDDTAAIGMAYQKEYPGTIVLVNKENGGHGSAINEGIARATGKYFKVVDGDDWVKADSFINYVKALKKLETDVVMTPFTRINDTTGGREERGFTGIQFDETYHVGEAIGLLGDRYQMHSVTFRTAILKKIPKISEHCFYVDQEYIAYPIKYAKSAFFLNEAVYQYRIGNDEQSMFIKNMQKNRDMHLRVIKNILGFLKYEELEQWQIDFLEDRIKGLCVRQIRIYLSLDDRINARKELDGFTDFLQKEAPNLYRSLKGKMAWLLRVSGNRCYRLLAVWNIWRGK